MAAANGKSISVHGAPVVLGTLEAGRLAELRRTCLAAFPAPKTPAQKYSVILCDPPWAYDNSRNTRAAEGLVTENYPTMTMEDLKALPVRGCAATNCALFLWTTSVRLPEAVELVKAWGFAWKTIFRVWRKTYPDGRTSKGLGYWSQGAFEFLVVATRGHGFLKHREANESQELVAPVPRRHSQKPAEALAAIERLRIPGKHLEMFARGNAAPGWDAWGLEVDGFFARADVEAPTQGRVEDVE